MSEKFRLDRKIGFQNTFYTKCINCIIDNIGPSIILRSIHIFVMAKPFCINEMYQSKWYLVSNTRILTCS